MQTFLPYSDFAATAAVLDDRRLGRQRVEALQILRALSRTTGGWINHPAVNMWRGFEEALTRYGLAICEEWCRRGHADTCDAKLRNDALELFGLDRIRSQRELLEAQRLPPWLGDERLHLSHRRALARKLRAHYATRFGEHDIDANEVAYYWPTPSARST